LIQTRRDGNDRRENANPGDGKYKRSGKDRRTLLEEQGRYIGIIQKIPIFKGLTLNQFNKILRICSRQNFAEDESVILSDDESLEMFILIKGMLKVVFKDGKELTRITPVEIVGEMGLFTRERRSASVIAAKDSLVLVIHKDELMKAFRSECELGHHMLTNVIRDIAHKLRRSNTVIEELRRLCFPGEFTSIISKTQDTEE